MDSLLFEHPLRWVLLCAGVILGFLAMARVRQARWAWRGVLVAIGLGSLGLVGQGMVQTPREQLIALCERMAHDVECGDLEALALHLDDALRADDKDREGFLEAARRTLTHYHPEEPRLGRFLVIFESDRRADVEFEASCRVVTSTQVFDRLLTRWRLGFVRGTNNVWKIRRIEVLPVGNSPIRTLSDLLH